jgi:hypothetical protein
MPLNETASQFFPQIVEKAALTSQNFFASR